MSALFKGVFKYKDGCGEWRQSVRTLKAQGIPEAKRELAELRVQLEEEHEQLVEFVRATMAVGEYVGGYIRRLADSQAIERTTYGVYRCVSAYIKNGLGTIRLPHLHPEQAAQAFAHLPRRDGRDAPQPRGAARALHRHARGRAIQAYLGRREPFYPRPLGEEVHRPRRRLLLRQAAQDTRLDRRHPPTEAVCRRLRVRKAAQETELVVAGLAPTEERMAGIYVLGGVDVKTVNSILGHSNAAITLNIYASADADGRYPPQHPSSRTSGAGGSRPASLKS